MLPKTSVAMFQSPQWGDNSKAGVIEQLLRIEEFQSPQWGDNSKEEGVKYAKEFLAEVSVPAMGR